jgi:two-component system nitrogen regulation response regulator GlnG
VSDIRMPGLSGLEMMQRSRSALPSTPVIIMTAYSDLESAVAAFQGGAFEYLPKPFDVDHAVDLVRRAMEESRRQVEVPPESGETPEISRPGAGDAGSLPRHRPARAFARDRPHHGESGTGKELVARALHRHSPRAARAFIAINTAAIPKDLLESELFAMSAAPSPARRPCAAAASSRPRAARCSWTRSATCRRTLQTRLLRVLSDGQFYRVGGHTPLTANVRVIAATHQDLEARVRQGLFREDLFHRLNVIRLRLPPMRERRETSRLLARHFLAKSARELGVEGKRSPTAALAFLAAQEWAGQRAPAGEPLPLGDRDGAGQVVDVKDLPPEVAGETTPAASGGPTGGARSSAR